MEKVMMKFPFSKYWYQLTKKVKYLMKVIVNPIYFILAFESSSKLLLIILKLVLRYLTFLASGR